MNKNQTLRKIALLGLILCLTSIAAVSALTGDVDNSGQVNIIDALITAQYYVGLNPPVFDIVVADVDGNGSANIIDALMIARYYVRLLVMFPVDIQPTPMSTGIFSPTNSPTHCPCPISPSSSPPPFTPHPTATPWPEGVIYSCSSPPEIDGALDLEWHAYDEAAINWFPDGSCGMQRNLVKYTIDGSFDDLADLHGVWLAIYDSNYLYLFLEAEDKGAQVNDSPEDITADDCFEVYLDLDNSKSSAYDENDFHFLFRLNDPQVYETAHNATEGIEFRQSLAFGFLFIIEARIPWSTLGGKPAGLDQPEANVPIGFDFQINDDDDGGARDGKKAWFDMDNAAHLTPLAFGTAYLR